MAIGFDEAQEAWETRDTGGPEGIHVYPLHDVRPHEATRTCWCRPKLDSENPKTRIQVWVHSFAQ